ncbi:class A beta-lactamase-related serine hydrolase [bacterium]|nr:MAG: class A beta-lactamase-related serine hydrolase [bacterium]
MDHRIFSVFGLSFFLCHCSIAQPEKDPATSVEHVRATERLTPQNLPKFLERVRVNYGLPALGVAILNNDKVTVVTLGVRKEGDPTPVTNEDAWHIGSCTKAMTATLMAMLVEDGKLSWESTLAEMLPDLAETMLPVYRDVTLRQLLSHRAGFPTSTVPPGTTYADWDAKKETLPEQRMAYAQGWLAVAPSYPPGSKMVYSNLGYVIAGAIAERISGESWEEQLKKRLFEPLGMKSVTYGTKSILPPVEPWPHFHFLKNGKAVAAVGAEIEIPLVLGPAGQVRCSLSDWAKYADFYLKGLRGESDLLGEESFRVLTTPPDSNKASGTDQGDSHALGWNVAKRSWSRGPVFYHGGSNLKNYSFIWLAPKENFAIMITTNRGATAAAMDDVSAALVVELSRLNQ